MSQKSNQAYVERSDGLPSNGTALAVRMVRHRFKARKREPRRMNRFSVKQTLSNFATAVRETVDSVNKYFLAAAVLIGAVAFSGIVRSEPLRFDPSASGVPSTGSNGGGSYVESVPDRIKKCRTNYATDMAEALKLSGTDKDLAVSAAKSDLEVCMPTQTESIASRRCEAYSADIDKKVERARSSCSSTGDADFKVCLTKISMCSDADRQVSEYNEEDEGEGYCDAALANKCPALPSFMSGRDYKSEKREAETDRKAAKRDLDELMDDDRKQKKELAQQQLDIQEQKQNSAAAFRDAQDKLSKKMENSLQGISDASKKAFDDAQTAANQMEVEYVKMRADARASADMVTQAEDDLQLMCRQSAEKKYAEAEKARLAAEKKGRKNLGTAISGAAKRKTSTILRQQAIDYQKYFTECTSGVSADGVGGKNRIATAKRAKDSADKLMAEKAALIEKQRAQMQSKLQQMESEATNQKSKVVQDIQSDLDRLTAEKTRTDQQNQQRIALMSSNNLQANLAMQNKINSANQELMKTAQEASLAVSRMNCAGRNSTKSDTIQDKTNKGFSDSLSDVRSVEQACTRFANNSCTNPPADCLDAAAGMAASKAKLKGRYQMKDGTTKK